MDEESKLHLGIEIDIEGVDAAFARLMKAKEEFESAAFDLQNQLSDESIQILVKGKPRPAATDPG
ncbi:MAG: hypothetical protein IJT01_08870 [Selenomonadaceae bacterium]|nr:hypothetical protein [Selenomonadaceae bacterium]